MYDCQIREELHRGLFSHEMGKASSGALVLDELALSHGASRADVVVIDEGLSAYEIKGDFDTLKRLPKQVEFYSRVFDYVTLIVGEALIDKAVEVIPDWWGVVLAQQDSGGVVFKSIRQPRQNADMDGFTTAQLLWKAEALEVICSQSLATYDEVKRLPRRDLYKILVENMDVHELRKSVVGALKIRKGWRDRSRPLLYGG